MLVWAARGAIAPGSAGLCVMWAVQFVISLNFNTINLTEAESKLTSVERVKEYSNLPQEPPHSIPHMSPPPSWQSCRGPQSFGGQSCPIHTIRTGEAPPCDRLRPGVPPLERCEPRP